MATSITGIGYKVDVASVSAAQKSARDVAKAQVDAAKQVTNSQVALRQAFSQSNNALRNAFKDLPRDLKAVGTEVGNLNRELRDLANVTPKRVGREQLGDLSTSLGSIASVASVTGNGAGVEALRFGGDAFGALEYAGRFKDAVFEVGETAASSSKIVGTLANTVSTLAPGLTAAQAGVAGLTLAVAPLAAAVAAAAIVFSQTQGQVEAANAASRAFFAQRNAETEFASFTTSDADAKRAELERIVADNNQTVIDGETAKQQAYAETREQIRSGLGIFGFAAETITKAKFEIEGFRGTFNDFNSGLNTAKVSAADAVTQLKALDALEADGVFEYNDALEESGELAKKAADEEKRLADERQRAADATASATANAIRSVSALLANGLDYEGQRAEIEKVTAALAVEEEVRRRLTAEGQENTAAFQASLAATEQLNATLNQLQLNSTYAAVAVNEASAAQKNAASSAIDFLKNAIGGATSGLADGIQEAVGGLGDLAKATSDYQKEQAAINDKIEQINDRAADAVESAQERIAEAITDAAEDIAQTQEDANRESQRREREHQQRMDSIRRGFEQEREDAILNQDVSGLLDAQRDFKSAKQEARQDVRDDRADSAEDLQVTIDRINARRDAEIAATNAQIVDIQNTAAAERAEIYANAAIKTNVYAQERSALIDIEAIATRIKGTVSGLFGSSASRVISNLVSAASPSSSIAPIFPLSSTSARNPIGMNNNLTINIESVGDNVNREQVVKWIGEGVRTGMRNVVIGISGANLDARFN